MVTIQNLNKQRTAAGASTTTTKYNPRTAEANAGVQAANTIEVKQQNVEDSRASLLQQHQAGQISTEQYNRQNAVLTDEAHRLAAAMQSNQAGGSQQHLSEAQSVYGNQAAGLQTSFNTESGQTQAAGNGAIQQSAIDRLRSSGMSEDQIRTQMTQSQGDAQKTMSTMGGPDTPFRVDPRKANQAKQAAATEAKISGIRGYTTKTYTDKEGNTRTVTVEDPNKTREMQDQARIAAEQKAAADANYAASLNEGADQTGMGATTDGTDSPPPNPDAFLASLDELEAQYAGSFMAPLFEFYKGQYMALESKGLRGEKLMAAVQQRTDEYVKQQKADMDGMRDAWGLMYDKILQSQLESAERTQDQQSRLAQQSKEAEQLEYERAIRDQNIRNEEDRQRLLLNNGISGGWRSSMHTSKMIQAFKKADLIVADLHEDKINNSKAWTNKMIDIEQNYHNNITAAYDSYNVNLLTLQDKLSERAREIDKTVYTNDVNQLNAVNKITEDWYDGVSKIAGDVTSTVIEIQKGIREDAKTARAELRQDQTDFRLRYQFHVGTYGSSDPSGYGMLVDEARELGISIPATAPETLEQKSMAMKQMNEGLGGARASTPHIYGGVNLSPIARNVVAKVPALSQKSAADAVYSALESGDPNLAMNALVTIGLDGTGEGTRTEYRRAQMGLQHSSRAIPLISGVEGMNIYETYKNLKLNKITASDKNPEWLNALGAYQLAMGRTVTDLIGTAQTQGEGKRLSAFAPDPGDTVQDAIIKLRNAHAYFQGNADASATLALGLGYGQAVRNGQIVNIGSPSNQQKNVDTYDDDPGMKSSQNAPEANMSVNPLNYTPVAESMKQKTGIIDWAKNVLKGKVSAGYDSGHVKVALSDNGLHGGLDVAMPEGSEIRPLVGGQVVSIKGDPKERLKLSDPTKSYGYRIVIKDNDGIFHQYAHLSGVPKWIKDALERGESPMVTPDLVVAFSGNSGTSTGPHLDYRARKADGTWIRVEDSYAEPPDRMIAQTNSRT